MTTSIYTDSLRLTADGEQAIADANSGGLVIRPVKFRVGDYEGQAPNDPQNQLLGKELASGPLTYCQVLTENTARFIFDVKLTYAKGDNLKRVGEVLIELENGRTFGHVVLSQPIIAVPNALTRISLLVHVQQDIQQILSVKLYDYSTIPSVAQLQKLPSMNDNYFNAVSVLDMHKNSDGSVSPGVAYRYGQGGFNWGFSEHDRVYAEKAGTAFINANTLELDLGIKENETVIIHTIAGPGAGAVRHFVKKGRNLINSDDPIPFFSAQTTIAVWRRITNPIQATAGIPWPQNSDVPESWVLARGTNDEPLWIPASGSGNKATATLFIPPSKMRFNSIVTTAVPGQLSYALSDDIESSANVLVGTSGVLQPRSAYFVQDDELILSSDVPSSMTLDIREFIHEPTQGHVVLFTSVEAYGDGLNSTFKLDGKVESGDMVFLIVGNTFQPTTSYKLEQSGDEITTTEPVPAGLKISVYCARYEERPGWSSRIRVSQFRFPNAGKRFILPVTPLSKSHVLCNVGGLPLHTQDFTLVGNVLMTNRPVAADTMVETTVFENVMSVGTPETNIEGVIIDVLPSPNGLTFMRQGLAPIEVPISAPEIRAGKGLRIVGTWPEIEIISVAAEQVAADPRTVFNVHQRVEDTEEVVIRQRVEFKKAVTLVCCADFGVRLGPGFSANTGKEHIQYVLSISTPQSPEAEYGRGLKGTGVAGFNTIGDQGTETMAYANVSATQMFDLMIENHPQGFVEVVAKVRAAESIISSYGSELTANLCIKVEPK